MSRGPVLGYALAVFLLAPSICVATDEDWLYMVLSRPSSPEQEAAFNTWYDDIDIPDVLAVSGFMRARRGRLEEMPAWMKPESGSGNYVALYDIETADVDKTIIDLYVAARKMGALDRLSDALKVTEANYYELIGSATIEPVERGEHKYIFIQKINCCDSGADETQMIGWHESRYLPAIDDVEGLTAVKLYRLYRIMEELALEQNEIPHFLYIYEITAVNPANALRPLLDALNRLKSGGGIPPYFRPGDSALYRQISSVRSR